MTRDYCRLPLSRASSPARNASNDLPSHLERHAFGRDNCKFVDKVRRLRHALRATERHTVCSFSPIVSSPKSVGIVSEEQRAAPVSFSIVRLTKNAS